MKKEHILFGVIVFALVVASRAQTVYQKDRWGAKLYYMQENTIRMKDRWGEPLLWYDAAARQVRQKDRWGQPLIYMDDNWDNLGQLFLWCCTMFYFRFRARVNSSG